MDTYNFLWMGRRLDPYRIADIYGITNHAQFHALKKILCAGKRGGGKTFLQDIREARQALDRLIAMEEEKGAVVKDYPLPNDPSPWE